MPNDPTTDTRSFSIDRLIKDSRGFFNLPPEDAVGGLYGQVGTMQVNTAYAMILAWLGTAPPGNGGGGGGSGPLPPKVAATRGALGTGDFNGQVGIIRIGSAPDDHEEWFVWNTTASKWVGRPQTVISQDDNWALDWSRQPLARFQNAWARPNGGVSFYRTGPHGYLRGTNGSAINVAAASIPVTPFPGPAFASSGQVLIRDQLIAYTGYTATGGSEALTGCSGGSGSLPAGYTPVIPFGSSVGGDRGGFGTTVVPLDHVKEMYDAGFTLEERVNAWLCGSQDLKALSVAPFYVNRDLADDFVNPTYSAAPPAGTLGPGITLVGPADPLAVDRAQERGFQFFSAPWTAWASSTPTKRVLIPVLYGKMPGTAQDNGEVYGYTLQLRWIG